MKIGILGGTFDPIHNGHIEVALTALHQFELDEVWLMPAKYPPHKQQKEITGDHQRITMLYLAVEEHPELQVSLFEYERQELSYTADTLRLLKEQYPDDVFYYIMGEDSLKSLPKWYQPQEIVRRAVILVASREPESDSVRKLANMRRQEFEADVHVLNVPWNPVSSTEIRRRVACCEEINDLVPESVGEYILEQGLYSEE